VQATQAQQAMTLPITLQLQQNKKRAPIIHKTSLRIKISIFNLYAELHFDLSKNLGCELQVLYTVAKLPKTLSVVQKTLKRFIIASSCSLGQNEECDGLPELVTYK
jgi:hypothetical protein